MIRVEPISQNEWLVTVEGKTATEHRVRLAQPDLRRLGGADVSAEQLLEASFRFLLDREPNTSILSSFDLPVISRYFHEYEKEIAGYLAQG
jgi:hypothetical protein